MPDYSRTLKKCHINPRCCIWVTRVDEKCDHKLGGVYIRALKLDNLCSPEQETILSSPIADDDKPHIVTEQRKHFLKSIYRRHRKALVRHVRGLVQGREDEADDVVQSVFTRFSALEEPQKLENPEGYLYRSARNLVFERARRASLEKPLFVNDELHSDGIDERNPERIELSREQLRMVEKVLKKMPPKRRHIFILLRVQGLHYREVSRLTGMSQAAIQKHMVRALNDCRHVMEGFAEKRHSGKKRSEKG